VQPETKVQHGGFSFTPATVYDYPFRISYRDTSVWIGSCFTSNIGDAMKSLKFHCEINPFGALYNPASILSSLKMMIEKRQLSADDLFEFNELWSSYYFHSSFSDIDQTRALSKMNRQLSNASDSLYRSKYLFITFGTAYVFRLKTSGAIVNNCHKLPSTNFAHGCLSIEEIVNQYTVFINSIENILPELKIVFSLSPVRHLKNGTYNNQISKSVLLLAIDRITGLFPDRCFYFPAYEIVLDELRDYRFYEKDLCHLSETAIDYIRNVFIDSIVDEQDRRIINEIEKLNLALAHRPFNTNTGSYMKFVANVNQKENELKKAYPYLDW
jgi:hypothetical protein